MQLLLERIRRHRWFSDDIPSEKMDAIGAEDGEEGFALN